LVFYPSLQLCFEAINILSLHIYCYLNSVAKKGLVTTEEIERMLKDASSELSNFKPTALKKMGIYEIKLVQGKKILCSINRFRQV